MGDASGGLEIGATTGCPQHIEVLADVDLDLELAPGAERGGRRGDHEAIGEHLGEIADEDGDTLAEPTRFPAPSAVVMGGGELGVDGERTPTGLAAIHDVVVDQGEGVQQLEGCARIDDGVVAGGSAGPDERPVAEGRTQSLAAAEHEPAQ